MKKVLSVFLTLAIVSSFAGCTAKATNKQDGPSETPAASQISSAGEKKNQADSTKEVTTEKKMKTLNITIGSTTFNAKLEDNDTAKALMAQLPLTVNLSELNGNEKFIYLPGNLSSNESSNPGTINEGDIMLYGKNCLVLFYKTFKTSYSYVKLGHISNTEGLAKALGSGDVRVTFSDDN